MTYRRRSGENIEEKDLLARKDDDEQTRVHSILVGATIAIYACSGARARERERIGVGRRGAQTNVIATFCTRRGNGGTRPFVCTSEQPRDRF